MTGHPACGRRSAASFSASRLLGLLARLCLQFAMTCSASSRDIATVVWRRVPQLITGGSDIAREIIVCACAMRVAWPLESETAA